MGLAVSWTIVSSGMAAQSRWKASRGKGTRFFIRLPISLAECAEPVPAKASPLPLPNAAPGTPVLVVDDEPIVSGVLSSILSRHGYRVTIANSAQEALEKVERIA